MSNQTNATITAPSCAYDDPKRTVLVADPIVCSGVCEVQGGSCKPVKMYASDTTTFSNVSALGRLLAYKPKELSITNANNLDIKRLVLPKTLTSLSFENVSSLDLAQIETPLSPDLVKLRVVNSGLVVPPVDYAWPTDLLEVTFDSNKLVAIPRKLPANLDLLSLQHNQIVNATGLPKGLGALNLYDNKIERAIGRDWRTLNTLALGQNPLNTFAFVKLSTTLVYFGCPNCPIQNLTLDLESFSALNALQPWNGNENKLRGFRMTLNVSTDPVACSSINGTVRQLWQGRTNLSVTACVVSQSTGIVAPYIQHFDETQWIVAGVVLALAVSLGVVLFLKWREFRETKKMSEYKPLHHAESGRKVLSYDTVVTASDPIPDSFSKLQPFQLAQADIIVTTKCALATGVFGEIWLGTYKEEKVAIKRLKDTSTISMTQFVNEIVLHASLSNEHIVTCLGAQWTNASDLQCVLEYMDMGDLRAYLATRSPALFSWSEKCKALLGAVGGLVYLHARDPPYVHGDIKSKNILLDAQKGAKLSDFGERAVPSATTFQWMAPEVLEGKEYTPMSDIYSLGVVFSELSTHIVPYADMKRGPDGKLQSAQVLMKKVAQGDIRPTFHKDNTPAWFLDLAMKCLAQDPSVRPTAAQVLDKVRHFKPIESTSRMSKRG